MENCIAVMHQVNTGNLTGIGEHHHVIMVVQLDLEEKAVIMQYVVKDHVVKI